MIPCFRFLLWDAAGPAGHRWRRPVALLHTLTPQRVRHHPGAVPTPLGYSGGDFPSLFYLPILFFPPLVAPTTCVMSVVLFCQSLAYVSNPVVIHSVPCEHLSPLSSVLSVSLACVNHLIALVSVRLSVCCWLDAFALHSIFTWHKTKFLASNHFSDRWKE